jgi:hypothetical protein
MIGSDFISGGNMLKKFLLVFCLASCLGILFFSGCKTADPASYTLTVTMGNGVTGTPATGSYTYTENDTVNYSYSAQTGYGGLTVTLDGAPVANAGTIAMTSSHTLNAAALIDIRGNWTGRFYFEGDDCHFMVTFSGGVSSGATYGMFDWQGDFVNGNFTLSGNQVDFDLIYYGGDASLTCSGILSDVNHMSGDWTWVEPGWEGSETFTLER